MATPRTMVAVPPVQHPSHTLPATASSAVTGAVTGAGTGTNGNRAAPPPTPRSRISSSSAATTIDNDGLLTPSPSQSHFTCDPIPILQPPQSHAAAAAAAAAAGSSNNSSPTLSSSPRRYPTDLTDPIPEEDDETESESTNEPITPVSGRESREFQALLGPPNSNQQPQIVESEFIASPDLAEDSATTPTTATAAGDSTSTAISPSATPTGFAQKEKSIFAAAPASKKPPPLVVETAATPPQTPQQHDLNSSSATDAGTGQLIESQSPKTTKSLTLTAANNPTCSATSPDPTSKFSQDTPTSTSPPSDYSPTTSNRTSSVSQYLYQQPSNPQQQYPNEHPSEASPPPRRPSLGNLSLRASQSFLGIGNKMTSLFRRSASNVTEGNTMEFREPVYQNGGAVQESNASNASAKATPSSSRRFSFHPSRPDTRSNSPPSPPEPESKNKVAQPLVPSSSDFLENTKKKSHTGFSLRSKVNFAGGPRKEPRRTRSVERMKKTQEHLDLTRQPWALIPDAGTGMKARRLSLSLPDDFTVDVAELLKEFEYQHKLLGRHGKHLGKGATSKVTLMARKGSPGELFAVKEFRSKRNAESEKDYEKKIKSEFSIAKSLHHPNIIETVRLCTDHGRWNHVMEYCSEGDLFSLVSKKYLQEEGREVDRHCLFKQLCQGVFYLHSNGIAHRDIKLENLLISKDSKLKITDFGVSEVFSGIHPGLREAGGQCGQGMNGDIRLCKPGICGSLPYIAPEVLSKQRDYDPRPLDVWSSAIVMIYLIFGANIWEKAEWQNDSKTAGQYNKLVQAYERYNARIAKDPEGEKTKDALPHLDAFDYCVKPLALRRLLLRMLNPDPEKRWSMAEVVTSRWFKTIECCQLDSYDDPVKFIDASKKNATISTAGKIYCHNHLPPQNHGHGLPPMPGKAGY